MKKPNKIGAGPLIVIETDVFGSLKSKPEYNFFWAANFYDFTIFVKDVHV
jgi:hypothetical protein